MMSSEIYPRAPVQFVAFLAGFPLSPILQAPGGKEQVYERLQGTFPLLDVVEDGDWLSGSARWRTWWTATTASVRAGRPAATPDDQPRTHPSGHPWSANDALRMHRPRIV